MRERDLLQAWLARPISKRPFKMKPQKDHRETHKHTATLLSNGFVLAVGSFEFNGSNLESVELYDPPAA